MYFALHYSLCSSDKAIKHKAVNELFRRKATGIRLADVETLLNMQYVPSKLKDQGTKVYA